VFDMRIYDGEFTVGSILERCRVSRRESSRPDVRAVDGVDLDELGRIVSRIPVDTIRSRRQRLNIFYEEVLVSADPDRGISFTTCLLILAHYNVINDSKSLRFVSATCLFGQLSTNSWFQTGRVPPTPGAAAACRRSRSSKHCYWVL